MKIFSHYLLRDLLTSLVVAALIVALIIAGRLLVDLSYETAKGTYPTDLVWVLLVFGVADSMIHLLPFCILLAVIISLSNLYQNNEIYAAYSIRISKSYIYSVLLRFVIPISLLLFYLALETLPIIQQQFEFIKQQGQQRIDMSSVDAGRFSKFDNGVLFIKHHEGNQARGIFLATTDAVGNVVLTTALDGQQYLSADGSKILRLEHGDVYQKEINEDKPISFYKISYDSHQIKLPEQSIDMPRDDPQTFSLRKLLETDTWRAQSELQKRLSIPLSLLVLLPFVEWVSRSSPKRHRQQSKLALGIVVFLIYSSLTIACAGMISSGHAFAQLGIWLVHGVVLVSGVVLASKRDMY